MLVESNYGMHRFSFNHKLQEWPKKLKPSSQLMKNQSEPGHSPFYIPPLLCFVFHIIRRQGKDLSPLRLHEVLNGRRVFILKFSTKIVKFYEQSLLNKLINHLKIVLFSLNRRRSAVHKRGKLVVSVHSFYCLPAKTFTVYVALVLCWSGYK